MKVLHLTPAISNQTFSKLNVKSSGLGYMVYDIVTSIAKNTSITVDLVFIKGHLKDFTHANVHFIESSYIQYIRHFSFLYCSTLFQLLKKYGNSFKSIRDCLYYFIISGYLQYVIKSGKYDLVHIHGCEFYIDYITKICKNLKVKYVVTLHGLNSFDSSVRINEERKKYERDFLHRGMQEKLYLTFVSTGCLNRACSFLKVKNVSTFNVVLNGTVSSILFQHTDIRKLYSIPKDSFIILYVENISLRKNQKKFIEAFSFMDIKERENIYILLLGRDADPPIKDFIIEKSLEKQVIYCGFIEKEKIYNYYMQSNAVALISDSEGFGLSLIEGMMHGLPSLMVEDMDAFADLYNNEAIVAIKSRNNDEIIQGIKKLKNTHWDNHFISDFAKRFSLEKMAENYINLYHSIIKKANKSV